MVAFRAEPPRDTLIAELADRQHGVVSIDQLRGFGLSRSAVSKRGRTGRIHRVHRGVYAVGRRRLTRHGVWMAAVLACGAEAVLSHRSAAGLWGLLSENRARTEVSVPRPSVRARAAIDVHASATLTHADVTAHERMPCTSVARTLLDLAGVVGPRRLERAVEQAEVLRLFDLRDVEALIARAGGQRGARVLGALLAGLVEPALTASELEERFLALCEEAALPRPAVNAPLGLQDGSAIVVDFLWRRERLVVETDGFGSHGTRQAFESDRLRDQRLRLSGYEVLRFTWRQVLHEPARVGTTVAALLARPAAR